MMHLRSAGSANIMSRVPSPGMFIKSGVPIRFAIPMRMNDRPIKASLVSSPSSHVYYKAGIPQSAAFKRPYASHLTAPGVFKIASAGKTAIKFQAAPPVPLRSKPEYIYEKVNVPKFPDPIRYNIGSDGAIHTIPAPNLGSKDTEPIPEVTANSLNSQFDSDLVKFSAQSFNHALEKPVSFILALFTTYCKMKSQ